MKAEVAFAITGSKSDLPTADDMSFRCVTDLAIANGISPYAEIPGFGRRNQTLLRNYVFATTLLMGAGLYVELL